MSISSKSIKAPFIPLALPPSFDTTNFHSRKLFRSIRKRLREQHQGGARVLANEKRRGKEETWDGKLFFAPINHNGRKGITVFHNGFSYAFRETFR